MEQKPHKLQKYKYPPKDELEYLYIKKNHTIKELAELYEIPVYTIAFLLSKKKYNIYKKPDFMRRRTKNKLKEKGLTKEKLYDLYIKEELPPVEIGKEFGLSGSYISCLLDDFGIPKRAKSESQKINVEKQRKKKEEEKKTFIHRKVDIIKKEIENGKIDIEDLNHKKACVLVSCNPGIERLRNLCNIYGYDFQILANTYRKLEKIWFNLNLYPKIKIKIAITLFLRYKISKIICSEICHVTPTAVRHYLNILTTHIKLTKTRREDPIPVVNIRWLFDNPNLPEIFETLYTYSEKYASYFCNIANSECEYYECFHVEYLKCNKPSGFRCQYAFFKSIHDEVQK